MLYLLGVGIFSFENYLREIKWKNVNGWVDKFLRRTTSPSHQNGIYKYTRR